MELIVEWNAGMRRRILPSPVTIKSTEAQHLAPLSVGTVGVAKDIKRKGVRTKMRALTIAVTLCFIVFLGLMVVDIMYSEQPRISTLRKVTVHSEPVPPLDLLYPHEPTPPFDLPPPSSIENNSGAEEVGTIDEFMGNEGKVNERRKLVCTTLCIIGYVHDKNCNCVPAGNFVDSVQPSYSPTKMKM